MLRIGARWRDCPPQYGPYTTIYNRFHRWSQQGVWFAVFEALTGYSGAWGAVAIAAQGAEVVIPPTRTRKAPIPYNREAYRARNRVERLWCRLKDWRRIATRYDKLSANDMAGVYLAATIAFWCD